MEHIEIKKRSQAERTAIALTLIQCIWSEELVNDECENPWDMLNLMTDLQVYVNRCVWKLNHLAFDEEEGEQNGLD